MQKFLRSLTACRTIEETGKLLRVRTQRWRGKPFMPGDASEVEESESKEGVSENEYDSLALLG